ncbi:MAG: cysteine hydrolase [Alphaproteobacteria bacterium]|nr:cysteine hydrolase [Alphaproteobacteria bacterium]
MVMQLGREDTALIVVDMQNGFLSPKGSIAKLGRDWSRLAAAIPGVQRLLAGARQARLPIFHTQFVYEADYRDSGPRVREQNPGLIEVGLCAAGSWDAEIAPECAPRPGEVVIIKNRPSSFYSTRLEGYLRSQKIRSVVVCGVTTNICVETTVRDAAQRDYRTFVVRDAVGEVEEDRHTVALKSMEYLFARVMTVDEVLAAWGVGARHAA